MYPEAFNKTIEELEKLPGVGHKTALRYAFRLLKMSKEELQMYLHFKRRGFTLPNKKREFKTKHKKNYLNEE